MYRDIASRRTGEEREILLALAEAERRHEQHWLDLLGDDVGTPLRGDLRTRTLGFLARRFGSVFVLALAQRAEARSAYEAEADATPTMAADEAHPRGGRPRPGPAGAQPDLGHVPRGGVRRQRRARQQPRARARHRRQRRVGRDGAAHGHGGAARRCAVDGGGGVRLGAVAAGAAGGVAARSRGACGAAAPRRRRQRARAGLPGPRHGAGGRPGAGRRGAQDAGPSPGARPGEPARSTSTSRSGPRWVRRAASFCFFASGALIPVLPYLLGAAGLDGGRVVAGARRRSRCSGRARPSGCCPGRRRSSGRCVSWPSGTGPRRSPTCSVWRSAPQCDVGHSPGGLASLTEGRLTSPCDRL